MSHGFFATNAPTPPSTEEIQRRKLVDRELRRLAKARRNRIKHHPCPTCETSGSIRRSFGFAYPGDPRSEAFQILVCPTCDGDGAQPPGREPARLRVGERAATLAEAFPDLYPERVISASIEIDVEDLNFDDISAEADQLLEEIQEQMARALGVPAELLGDARD